MNKLYLKYKTNEIPMIIQSHWDYITGTDIVQFYLLLDGKYLRMKTQYNVRFPKLIDKFYCNLKHRIIVRDVNLSNELDSIL